MMILVVVAKPQCKKVTLNLLLGLKRLNNIYRIGSIGLQFPNPKTLLGQVLWNLLLKVSFQNQMRLKLNLNINIRSSLMKDLKILGRLISYVFKGIRKRNQSGGKLLQLQPISFIIHNFKQLALVMTIGLYLNYKTAFAKVNKLANQFHLKKDISSQVPMKGIDSCTTNKTNYKHY